MEQQYVIGVIVANVSGVLSRVSGMFTRRGFNIDSLTVGETESSGFSRITIAFHGDEDIKERILQQLQKLHDVREVEVLENKDTVIRELLLIKVRNKAEIRQDIMTAVEIFRSKIVDYSPTCLTRTLIIQMLLFQLPMTIQQTLLMQCMRKPRALRR